METLIVVFILFLTFALFITEAYSIDLIAFIALSLLLIFGIITPSEAISGFSNPATVTIAAMFVLSAALVKTGALHVVAQLLFKTGDSPFLFVGIMMGIVAVCSAFINNTGVVAVFIPLIINVASKHKLPLSKVLIPLSFASQAGGVCTLIGSSTNLVVSAYSEQHGYGSFDFFEMGRWGVVLVILVIAYFLSAGKYLLPVRKSVPLTTAYHLGDYITELRVKKNSPFIGKSVKDAKFIGMYDVRPLKLIRGNKTQSKLMHTPLNEGDLLLVEGKIKDLMHLKEFEGVEIEPEFQLRDEELKDEDVDLVEALIPANSRLIGSTLKQSTFQQHYNVVVLAMKQAQKAIKKIADVPVKVGDTLLIQGHIKDIKSLMGDKDLIIIKSIEGGNVVKKKAPVALLILTIVILLPVLHLLPIVASAMIGVVMIALTRCLSVHEFYDAIDWRIILLLAGIIPLGVAMEKSSVAQWIVSPLLSHDWGPYIALSTIYLITTVLTELMSNNAAAVLLCPIAILLANGYGFHPKPFLMAVAFAASTSFMTPIGYQTNTMVYIPGGYRFLDFVKVGLPLNLFFWILSSLLIPYLWPFSMI